MNKGFKTILVCLIAAFALSAVAASAASATKFKSTKYPVKITATQTTENVFTVGTTTVKCKKASFTSGSIAAESESIKVAPSYSECTAFGFVGATVSANGCEYELFTSGSINIVCAAGKAITVEATGCTLSVGKQEALKSVSYAPLAGPPKEVEITNNVKKVKYTTNAGILCPKEGEESSLSGKEKAKGVNPSKETEQYGIEVA